MSLNPEEEEEEVKKGGPRGRPNAFWAEQLRSTYEESGFRGVRGVPHGGQQTVSPDDIAGSMEYCWCGLPYDHDWPGKASGRNHPRKEATEMSQQPTNTDHIDRRALRAYNPDLVDLIVTAVNKYGVKYRLTAHSVLLFPPDGTPTFTINARSSDRQVKSARTWFVRHCVSPEELAKLNKANGKSNQPVTADTIKQLAEAVNSPEHLPKLQEEHKPAPQPPTPPQATPKSARVVQEQPAPQSEEWVPKIVGKGRQTRPHEIIETNGQGSLRCNKCQWVTEKGMTSILGHIRTHHTNTDTLWGKAAKEKAVDTYYRHKHAGRIAAVIEELQDIAGIKPQTVDTTALTELQEENAALKRQIDKEIPALRQENAALKQQIEDLNAKMALAREAFGL